MQPDRNLSKSDLFRMHFDQQLNPDHPLRILAEKIDWAGIDQEIDPRIAIELGGPNINNRILVGLLYLKLESKYSDEAFPQWWVKNL